MFIYKSVSDLNITSGDSSLSQIKGKVFNLCKTKDDENLPNKNSSAHEIQVPGCTIVTLRYKHILVEGMK